MQLHHIAIITSDYQKGKAFYCDILGFSVIREIYREERKSFKTDLALNGEYLIELFSFENPPKRLSYPEACGLRHLSFLVDDIHAQKQKLSAQGIACEEIRIDPYTEKEFFFIQDPDGLPIEFYQR